MGAITVYIYKDMNWDARPIVAAYGLLKMSISFAFKIPFIATINYYKTY